eukprot:103928-Chlamydomonas_euryale.AAC.1
MAHYQGFSTAHAWHLHGAYVMCARHYAWEAHNACVACAWRTSMAHAWVCPRSCREAARHAHVCHHGIIMPIIAWGGRHGTEASTAWWPSQCMSLSKERLHGACKSAWRMEVCMAHA